MDPNLLKQLKERIESLDEKDNLEEKEGQQISKANLSRLAKEARNSFSEDELARLSG